MKPRGTHLTRYIRARRKHLGLTQREVAEALGYKPQFVTNWERGTSRPPEHTLKKLCRVLDTPVPVLVEILSNDSREHWCHVLGRWRSRRAA